MPEVVLFDVFETYTLAGEAPPLRDVARAELAATGGLDEDQIGFVLAGFAELPLQLT